MANLAWHQKYHPKRVCDFDNAVAYNAWMLRSIDEQMDKAEGVRLREKNAYRLDYAINDYEFRVLREDGCAVDAVDGFDDLEMVEEPVQREDFSAPVDVPVEREPAELAREKKKPLLSKAQKKKWIRRAVYGGLALSTLAIAGALGYWAFKPKKSALRR